MTNSQEFAVNYVSPSIFRCGHHEFGLEYREPRIYLLLRGEESSHPSGGMLYFPTSSEWARDYPNLIDQRERIKSNIISWSNESPHSMGFIADFLSDEQKIEMIARQRDQESASIPQASAELLAEVERWQQAYLKSLTPRGRFMEGLISTYIPTVSLILIFVYIGYLFKPHFDEFW